MIPAQFGIDIFKEIDRLISRKFKLIIFQGIIDELKVLLQSSVKKQKEVQIALELTKRCEKIDLNSDKITGQTIDDKIFQLATSNRWIVATNDRKLRKKLRAHQVPVITLRKKAYLIIEGDFSS